MNFEGMRRRGFSAEAVHALRNAYKIVYRKGLTVEAALSELAESAAAFPEVAIFRDSIRLRLVASPAEMSRPLRVARSPGNPLVTFSARA